MIPGVQRYKYLDHSRRHSLASLALRRLAICSLLGIGLLVGCAYEPPPTMSRPLPATRSSPHATTQHTPASRSRIELPTIRSVNREPVVRVRLERRATRVSLTGTSGQVLLIGPAAENGQAQTGRRFTNSVTITHYNGAFHITDSHGRAVRWALDSLNVGTATGSAVSLAGKTYPGTLVLTPSTDSKGRALGGIDAVNHLPMESYLPGVVERELYGSWDPKAFRAAAIAARSYAVFESSLNRHLHYDLESSTASQAYGGQARNPKAIDAVRRTRGQLLAYQGRVVPAFYSSACGGLGQDATVAFTWMPGLPNIDPLRGRNHGNWCQASNKFRWGPVTRSTTTLAQRIAAWGKAESHAVASLRGIRDIRVQSYNSVGRNASFVIYDLTGSSYTIGPEQFRFACNTALPGNPVPKEQRLNSSQVSVRVSGAQVTFSNGRGYGHGVGLCQFGAQGLAKAGYNAYSILNFYYPGSQVVTAYR